MKLDLAVGPGALDNLQVALDTVWSRHDHVPAINRLEVEIAATEIAVNILEHGCAAGLQMEIHVVSNEVRIEFTDSGHPAEIDLVAIRNPDEVADRGRGLAIAQAALRLLAYCRDERGNHWRLVSKAFPASPRPE